MEPGPGEYKKIEVVGNLNASKLTSIIPTSQANAFSKAKDRFSVPSKLLLYLQFIYSFEGEIAGARSALPKDKLLGTLEQFKAPPCRLNCVR